MNYLLDTCVISELMKKTPSETAVRWLTNTPDANQYLSSITIGEIQKGIFRLEEQDLRRALLSQWLMSIRKGFAKRIIPFDEDSAVIWGKLIGESLRIGRPKPIVDSQIAATALSHGMALVTRNVPDMADFGVEIVNPFS